MSKLRKCQKKRAKSPKLKKKSSKGTKSEKTQPKQNTSVRYGEKVKIVRPTSGKAQIEYVVKTIRDLLGKEYINKDGDKAVYDYGDFAILSRQRKYGRDFVDELKTYDIPTTFRGDYNMFESPVIAEVLQYIHIIQSPSTA